MSRRFLVPVLAVVALALLGAGAGYAYFFSGLRSTPAALALPSPPPLAPPTGVVSPSPSTSVQGGGWQVSGGSMAGYRVSELFVGQATAHEAVARTSTVSGQVQLTAGHLDSATVSVQLAGLQSTDTVAGYNVANRDRIVNQALAVGQFPAAVFVADPLTLPAGYDSGQAVSIALPGRLTIHGVTRTVTANLQLRVTGSTAQAAGSIAALMTDYGINPPSLGFTAVQPAVTIEFQLNLAPV